MKTGVKQFESLLSGLIGVKTVCKCYQQTKLASKEFNMHLCSGAR